MMQQRNHNQHIPQSGSEKLNHLKDSPRDINLFDFIKMVKEENETIASKSELFLFDVILKLKEQNRVLEERINELEEQRTSLGWKIEFERNR